jgi:hypothetical protein
MLRDTLEALACMFLSALLMRLANIRMDRISKKVDENLPQ